MSGLMLSPSYISEARLSSRDPRELLNLLVGKDVQTLFGREEVSDEEIWLLLFRIASFTDRRMNHKHRYPISDIEKVIDIIDRANNIVVLLGAGGSVGPDFRSPGGLYDQIAKAGVLSDPCDVFDIHVYRSNPEIFWRFAHLIFPSSNPTHSAAHYFIENLEKRHKLMRLYSQNVDTLECGIPVEKLKCVHGSWRENPCTGCGRIYGIDFLRSFVEMRTVPHCPECGSIIQPGIVFFGQPTHFDEVEAYTDSSIADLLLVIGTSLKVAPISELPQLMRSVPSVLINRAPTSVKFNAELLGECDDIVSMLEFELGWRSDGPKAKSVVMYRDRSFVLESPGPFSPKVIETSHGQFLASSQSCDVSDLN